MSNMLCCVRAVDFHNDWAEIGVGVCCKCLYWYFEMRTRIVASLSVDVLSHYCYGLFSCDWRNSEKSSVVTARWDKKVASAVHGHAR